MIEQDKIICGDNCAVLAAFPPDCIDLVVTSPPYDDLRTYGGHSWNFDEVARQLLRVVKDGGVVVWIVADKTEAGSETGTSFRQALRFMEIGFRLHDTMIWDKESCCYPESSRYQPVMEYMFVLSKQSPKSITLIEDKPNKWAGSKVHGTGRNIDGTTVACNSVAGNHNRTIKEFGFRTNIWRCPVFGIAGNKHPAPFPEELARDHIISWSNEGDVVLDPFNGSGTTTKMARELGRHYIGIDVHEEYCEMARKRLDQQLLFGIPE